MIDRCPPLRDNHHYLEFVQFRLTAHHFRRDAVQFVKALATFNQTNLKKALPDNGAIVMFAIHHASCCFDLSLVDEGFQIISKVNSTHIDSHQFTFVKSTTVTNQYECIMVNGLRSDELSQLKLLGQFYRKMKLNLPERMKQLKAKIRELVRLMHIDLLRKVMGVANPIGEEERVYWMGERVKDERIGKEMRKLHQKGRQSDLMD